MHFYPNVKNVNALYRQALNWLNKNNVVFLSQNKLI